MFEHNYPKSLNAISALQSGLTFLKKEAEYRDCHWQDLVQRINDYEYSVLAKGGEFKAIVNIKEDTCSCVSREYCWHKAIVACIISGQFPEFNAETTRIVTSKIKETKLYELFVIFDGKPISVKGFQRELVYWKPIIKKTANKSQLILLPQTKEAMELLHV
jgi:hypothetical protein